MQRLQCSGDRLRQAGPITLVRNALRDSRVALLWGGVNAPGELGALTALRADAPALGIMVLSAEAREPNEVPVALATISQQRPDGFYVWPSSTNTDNES